MEKLSKKTISIEMQNNWEYLMKYFDFLVLKFYLNRY